MSSLEVAGQEVPFLRKESYQRLRLENGLTLFLMQREGVGQTLVSYVVPYGAGDVVKDGMPAGVAHFLEHMMFHQPDGEDIRAKFQQVGVEINALTTSYLTSYSFICGDGLEENLHRLIRMMGTPHFPQELVDAEANIIKQEVQLYRYDTLNHAMTGLLRVLYGEGHPLSSDILGHAESIERIDPEWLKSAYQKYYDPESCFLVVIGPVELETVAEMLRNDTCTTNSIRKPKEDLKVEAPQERNWGLPVHHLLVEEMETYAPMILMGVREDFDTMTPQDLMQMEQITSVALEALTHPNSPFVQRLSECNLLIDQMWWDVEYGRSFGYVSLGAMVTDLEFANAEMRSVLHEVQEHGLPESVVMRARNRLIARSLRRFDELGELELFLSRQLVRDFAEIDVTVLLERVTAVDVHRRLQTLFTDERIATFLIRPIEEVEA